MLIRTSIALILLVKNNAAYFFNLSNYNISNRYKLLTRYLLTTIFFVCYIIYVSQARGEVKWQILDQNNSTIICLSINATIHDWRQRSSLIMSWFCNFPCVDVVLVQWTKLSLCTRLTSNIRPAHDSASLFVSVRRRLHRFRGLHSSLQRVKFVHLLFTEVFSYFKINSPKFC